MIMAMQAESLEVLEKANVPASQARAIVRAIEIEIAGAQDVLATKQDIFLTRTELRQEMSELREEMSDLRQDMSELKRENHKDIANLRDDVYREMSQLKEGLRNEMTQLKEGLQGEMSQLRGGVEAMRHDMTKLHHELDVKIEKMARSLTRQTFTVVLSQTATLFGMLYFFGDHLIR
jgi:cell division protein FtsB